MTISSTASEISYAGNGATLAFAIPFPFDTSADIKVTSTVTATGDVSVLSSGFAITGGGGSTGTITFTTAPASTVSITLIDDPARTQPTDYVANDAFPAESHERALDRVTRLCKRLYQRSLRSLRVPDGDPVTDAELAPVSTRKGKYLFFDAITGAIDYATAIATTTLSQGTIGALLYPRTAAEISAGVTPTNYAYPPGHEARFGMVADSTTDNTTALQNLINGSAGYAPIVIRRNGSGYYKFTGRVTVPANTTIILMDGAEFRWTATAATGTNLLGVATRPGFELLGSNVQIIGSGTIRGPSSATFVTNEIGIFSKGTSSSSRFSNFTLGDGVLLEKWGYAGVALQYWNVITLSGFRAFDCGHAGFFAFSCGQGKALGIDIDTIGPGDGSGQAYGFSLTHDSTDYDIDPNIATPRLVANPFCNDWEVTGTIANVPTWQGFDAHGAYDTRVHHMVTYNCRKGISIGNSSGDAANYAGENNSIDHVYCTTKKRDGSATSVSTTDRDGITLNGGSTVKHANVSLDNFVVDGYGDTVVSSLSVQAYRCTGARITNGRILNWKGYGIGCANGNGIIDNVLLGAVASTTNSICIYHDYSVASGRWDVRSVRHRADGGSVASEGLRIVTSNSRAVVAGNDFSEATAPYAGDALMLTKGASDPIPTLSVTGAPTSINLSTPELNLTPRVRVTLDTSGGSTITDITGAYVGQIIELYAPTTNVTVLNRTNAGLAGGANWSSSQYDTLVLECVNTSGVKFVEISRSANS